MGSIINIILSLLKKIFNRITTPDTKKAGRDINETSTVIVVAGVGIKDVHVHPPAQNKNNELEQDKNTIPNPYKLIVTDVVKTMPQRKGFPGSGCSLTYKNNKISVFRTDYGFSEAPGTHMHQLEDEMAFVHTGTVIAIIGDTIQKYSKNTLFMQPKEQFHSTIALSPDVSLITTQLGNNDTDNWETKIEPLARCINKIWAEKEILVQNDYNEYLLYLRSPILQVRWIATEEWKKILKTHTCSVEFVSKFNQTLMDNLSSSDNILIIWAISMIDVFTSSGHLNISPFNKYIIKHLASANIHTQWLVANIVIKNKLVVEYDKIVAIAQKELKDYAQYQSLFIIASVAVAKDGDVDKYKNIENMYITPHFYDANFSIKKTDILLYFFMFYLSIQNKKAPFHSITKESINNLLKNLSIEKNIKNELTSKNIVNEIYYIFSSMSDINISTIIFKLRQSQFKEGDLMSRRIVDEDLLKTKICKYLRIIVSDKCNFKCPYCHNEGRNHEIHSNLSFNLDELLYEAKKLEFEKIKISGGEPLLFPKLLETLNKHADSFNDIGITTNGSMLNQYGELLKTSKHSISFNVTLNTVNNDYYLNLTGQNVLQDVINGIKLLKKLDFKVKINSVITDKNKEQLKDLIDFSVENKVDIKFLDLVNIQNNEHRIVTCEQIRETISNVLHLSSNEFKLRNDYYSLNYSGISIMIPARAYAEHCHSKCDKYPCAEGLFGIRIFEDYSVSQCFESKIIHGDCMISSFFNNINIAREGIRSQKFNNYE